MGATSSCVDRADESVMTPVQKSGIPVGRSHSAEDDEWETELPAVEYRLQRGDDPLASMLVESKRLRMKANESICGGSKNSAKREAKARAKSRIQLISKLDGMLSRGEAFVHIFQAGDTLGFTLSLVRFVTDDNTSDLSRISSSRSANSSSFGRRCAAVEFLEARLDQLIDKKRYYPHGTLPMPTDILVSVDNEPLPLDLDVVQFAKVQARLKNSGRPLRLMFLPGQIDRDQALIAESERHYMRAEDLADRDTAVRARARSCVAIATEAANIAGRKAVSAQERLDAVATRRAARKARRFYTVRSGEDMYCNSSSNNNSERLIRYDSDDTTLFLHETANRASIAAKRGLESALKLVTNILLERGETARATAASARKEADLTMARKNLLEAALSDENIEKTLPNQNNKALLKRIPSPSTTATVFEPGDRVRVCGLRKATTFNDRVGIVQELDEHTHRILVHFDDGSIVSVRPINLCPHDTHSADKSLAVGSRIAITGLRTQLNFNGQEGTVSRFDPDTMRYYVSIQDGQQAALKPGNLEVIAKQTGSPAAFQSSIRQKVKRAALAARRATEASKELAKWIAALNLAANGHAISPSSPHAAPDANQIEEKDLFHPGDPVVLVGVAMFPQLNGARCRVKEWDNERYLVERQDTGNTYSAEACILVSPENGGNAAAQSRETTAAARREAKAAKSVSQQAAAAFPMYDEFSPASRVSSINIDDIADLDDLGVDDDASLHGDYRHHNLFEEDEEDQDDDDDFSRDDDFSILPSDYASADFTSGDDDDDDPLQERMSADISGAVCPVDGSLSYSPQANKDILQGDGVLETVEDEKEPEDFYEKEDDIETDKSDNEVAPGEIPTDEEGTVESGKPGYFYDAELAKSTGGVPPDDSDIEATPERQLSSASVPEQRQIDHIDEPPLDAQLAKPELTDAISEPTLVDSPQVTRRSLPEIEEPSSSSQGLTRERLRQLDLLSGTPPTTPYGAAGTIGQPFGEQGIATGDLLDFDLPERRQERSGTQLSDDLWDLNNGVKAQVSEQHDDEEKKDETLPQPPPDEPLDTNPLVMVDDSSAPHYYVRKSIDGAEDAVSSNGGESQREDPRQMSGQVEANLENKQANVMIPEVTSNIVSSATDHVDNDEEPPRISLEEDDPVTHVVTPDFHDEQESEEDVPWSTQLPKSSKDKAKIDNPMVDPPQQQQQHQPPQEDDDDVSSLSTTRSVNSKRDIPGLRRKTNELLEHPIFARQQATTTSPTSRGDTASSSEALIESGQTSDIHDRESSKRRLAATYEKSLAAQREEARRLKEQQTAAAAAAARSEIKQRNSVTASSTDNPRMSPVVEFDRCDTDDECDEDDDDDEEDGQLVTPMNDDFLNSRPPPPPVSYHESVDIPVTYSQIPTSSQSAKEEQRPKSMSYNNVLCTPPRNDDDENEALGPPMSYDEAVGRTSRYSLVPASPIVEFNVLDDDDDDINSKPPIARSIEEDNDPHDAKDEEDASILNVITTTLFGWSSDSPPPVKESSNLRESRTSVLQ